MIDKYDELIDALRRIEIEKEDLKEKVLADDKLKIVENDKVNLAIKKYLDRDLFKENIQF